jgi:hypothetical protein
MGLVILLPRPLNCTNPFAALTVALGRFGKTKNRHLANGRGLYCRLVQ